MFAIGGVVLVVGCCRCHWWGGVGHCHHWWGGAGPGSSLPMLGVVMGHRLGGWWWALVAVRVDTLPLHSIVVVVVVACHCRPSVIVVLCWVEIGRRMCHVADMAPGSGVSKQ